MEKQVKMWSVGHSNRSITEFIDLLKSADIQTVIDVRTKPRSRFWWFGGSSLNKSLAENDMRYEWRGLNIGGLTGNVNYDETLDELVERATTGERIALLCSEGKPQDCHRGTELTPGLEARSITVEHLLYGRSV
ncbi:MAG: DUF488 domain-containing protein [Candidatus Saccharimonadales bacterium]